MASTHCSSAPGCTGCKWSEATRPGRTGEAVALIRFQPELWGLRENKQGSSGELKMETENSAPLHSGRLGRRCSAEFHFVFRPPHRFTQGLCKNQSRAGGVIQTF